MQPKPIEVVVIRDAIARPAPIARALPPPQGGPPPPEVSDQQSEVSAEDASPGLTSDLRSLTSAPDAVLDLSPEQQRDLAGLLDALSCPVRQRILLALAAAGPGGANPTALESRTGIAQKTLSHHLAFLRTAGLVHDHRRGREVWYEPAADRLRCQRHADGGFALTLTARGGGVGVTLTLATDEARLGTD